jgi:hypothetical protein
MLAGEQIGSAAARLAQRGIGPPDRATAFDASPGTQHASTGRGHQHPLAAAVRAGLLGVVLTLPPDTARTQFTADDAHRRSTRRAVTLSFPHRVQPLSD